MALEVMETQTKVSYQRGLECALLTLQSDYKTLESNNPSEFLHKFGIKIILRPLVISY